MIYDVVIVGGGPGGINSSIYLKRMGKNIAIVEGNLFGGALNNTDRVENYLGYEDISGEELAENMESQMYKWMNSENIYINYVQEINKKNDLFYLTLDNDEVLKSKTVILATGADHKKLGVEGEELSGVSYCAVCDGFFFKDRNVFVVGGGNSALEEAIYLSNIAKNVTIIHRRNELRADEIYKEMIMNIDNINVIWDSIITKIKGDDKVSSVELFSNKDKKNKTLEIDGLFVYIGLVPILPKFNFSINKDEFGFIKTTENMETSVKGLFAIGDIRSDSIRQIISAAGDASIVSKIIFNYLNENQ